MFTVDQMAKMHIINHKNQQNPPEYCTIFSFNIKISSCYVFKMRDLCAHNQRLLNRNEIECFVCGECTENIFISVIVLTVVNKIEIFMS